MTPFNKDSLPPLGGLLLGGQSRRMGQSKGFMPLPGGQSMGVCCLNTLKNHCEAVYQLGDILEIPLDASLPILADNVGRKGPLAGLEAALQSGEVSSKWLFLPWDMPLITDQELAPLVAALNHGAQAACYQDADAPGGLIPFPLALNTNALPHLKAFLDEGRRSVWRFVLGLDVTILPISPEGRRRLTSVNTPEEMEAVRALLGQDPKKR